MRGKALFFAVLLTGCAQTPPPGLKQTDVPAAFEQAVLPGAANALSADWWRGLGSRELAAFIEAGAEGKSRYCPGRSASAPGGCAGPPGRCSAAAQCRTQRQRQQSLRPERWRVGRETDFSAALGASYELDFWGKNRAAADSASALRQAGAAIVRRWH